MLFSGRWVLAVAVLPLLLVGAASADSPVPTCERPRVIVLPSLVDATKQASDSGREVSLT